MLELHDVHVHIHEFTILRGVSLTVPPGQVVGLVGRNGAGKTTTLKSIMGLVAVRSGTIRLDGHDLLRMPAHGRARLGIGYVPEDRRLIGTLTVEENILLPAWAMGWDGQEERLEEVYHLLPEVKELAGRRAAQLSGGQQKLVALARALMSGRKLLLLDEPFEGLAPPLSQRLSEVIRNLQEQGVAILVAESDLKPIGPLAERVYTIERGEILDEVL
jgi:branched-chain amino acid transport system ATP-binding protein